MPFSTQLTEDQIVPTGIWRSRYGRCFQDQRSVIIYKPPQRINPVARTLLLGASDQGSALCVLAGHSDVLELIYGAVCAAWADGLEQACRLAANGNNTHGRAGNVCFDHVDNVIFPEATGAYVNMMPFEMGNKESLPREYHGYWPMIDLCVSNACNSRGKIGYLTIHEGPVTRDKAQRRPGLHTEGFMSDGDGLAPHPTPAAQTAGGQTSLCRAAAFWHPWGMGQRANSSMGTGSYQGGLFMASTLSGTCRLWDVPLREGGLVGRLGDIEHLRHALCERVDCWTMQANELFWMCDDTPHESCPPPDEGYRQYFRLVTNEIAVWYTEHSTPNPLGVEPPPSVQIIAGSKFNPRPRPTCLAPCKPALSSSSMSNQSDGSSSNSTGGSETGLSLITLERALVAAMRSMRALLTSRVEHME